MPAARSWSDDDLERAVAASCSMLGVMRSIGLRAGGNSYINVRDRVHELGLDTSHFGPRTKRTAVAEADCSTRPQQGGFGGRRRSWTDDDLINAVRESKSVSAVIRELGLQVSGGTHTLVTFHIRRLGIDTTHFTGQGWARGTTGVTSHPRPLAEILVRNSNYQAIGRLRQRLISAGLKPGHCEICGLREWRGTALPLSLDHINGDRMDNRLENLRVLCPNCHSQTATWCKRKDPPT